MGNALSLEFKNKSAKNALLAAVFVFTATPQLAFAQSQEESDASRADIALAAITYNFARFIQWRDQDSKAARENFSICIIDEDPSTAWQGIEGKAVGQHKVALLYRDDILSLSEQCDMAYVSAAQQKLYSMKDFAKDGIVTISDSVRFTSNGGAIGFSLADNRATFDVNEQALSRAGARVSSKLMRVGMRVNVSDS